MFKPSKIGTRIGSETPNLLKTAYAKQRKKQRHTELSQSLCPEVHILLRLVFPEG